MNPSIQVFLQVALLCCVVTTSIGGITDLHKAFSELENKVKESQEEIKSLHKKIEHLEKRLEPLEEKSEFCDVQMQFAGLFFMPVIIVRTILLLAIEIMSTHHCMTSPNGVAGAARNYRRLSTDQRIRLLYRPKKLISSSSKSEYTGLGTNYLILSPRTRIPWALFSCSGLTLIFAEDITFGEAFVLLILVQFL